jgi:hypothetical protein
MERIPTIPEMNEQVHMLFGYSDDTINTSWGKQMSQPVSETNPSRGFFAGTDMIQAILDDEGRPTTIDRLCYTIGRTLRTLIEGGIVPIDLEFIYAGNGMIALLDFGLCRFGNVDPESYFTQSEKEGLASELYVPKKGLIGYEAYYNGYFNK